MKPYKNLQSQNLPLLLLIARFTAVIGIVFFIVAILATLITIPSGVTSLLSAIVFIPMAIVVLLMSGVMAAIVSFEENYRQRTAVLINENKHIS